MRSFDHEDLRLLETLATNASVALQYDRLEQAVLQLSVLQEQLHHQAYHDPLTDLPNRSLFMDRVKQELADGDGAIAVLFIDVDDFKIVNDSLGHAVGDALLVSVAGRLRHSVRPQDVRPTALNTACSSTARQRAPGIASLIRSADIHEYGDIAPK